MIDQRTLLPEYVAFEISQSRFNVVAHFLEIINIFQIQVFLHQSMHDRLLDASNEQINTSFVLLKKATNIKCGQTK